MEKISHFRQLRVYHAAVESAMKIRDLSSHFPHAERFSLTDQIRRSSRSVAANIAEGWGKRRYAAAFVCKLNDSESEAYETQAWIEFAAKCGYIEPKIADDISREYDHIVSQLIVMMNRPYDWVLPQSVSDASVQRLKDGKRPQGNSARDSHPPS